jgi:hypothetical protein
VSKDNLKSVLNQLNEINDSAQQYILNPGAENQK